MGLFGKKKEQKSTESAEKKSTAKVKLEQKDVESVSGGSLRDAHITETGDISDDTKNNV